MRVELLALSKSYEGARALDKTTLIIEPGQIIAVLGANGAGKTTLLRCLAGIVAPDSGTIHYDEQQFTRDRLDLRRRFCFIPDAPFVFHEMSVIKHVGMMVRLYGAEREGLAAQVVEWLREFDLLACAELPFHKLSRGEIYKGGLVGLLAVNPEIWLMDEPFASGMDPHGINTFKRLAREAVARGGTVIYSTQILELAERFSDRVCVLHKGELRAFDSITSLKSGADATGSPLENLFAQLREEDQS